MTTLSHIRTTVKRYLELGEVRKPISFLYPYVKRHWPVYLGLIILLVLGIAGALFLAWYLQNITDAAVIGDLGRVGQLLLLGVFFMVFNGIVTYCNIYLETTAVQKIKQNLKNDLFSHILRLPARFYGNHHSGKLVSHLTNDINSIEGAIGGNLLGMLRLPLMAVAAFIYLVNMNWQLSLVCILFAPLAAISGAVFGKLIRNNSKVIHEYISKLISFLHDSFSGHTVIRSFTLEKLMFNKYEEQNQQLLTLELKLAKLRGWFQVGAGAAGTMTFILSLGLGAYFVAGRTLSVGSLLAFVSLMQYLVHPLTRLAGLWGVFQRSIAAVERIQKLFGEPVETIELESRHHDLVLAHSIRFQDVSFGYGEENEALSKFSLTVPAGTVVALVGPSGAGKSTLFQLIQGFYVPDSGEILFDNQPSHLFSPAQLRRLTAYVPQETYLFAGTIRENIAYGRKEATESEILKSAIEANAHDFIVSLPDGYDTVLGERGAKISGGQRQRIAIARAILKDAPILLLDEATSSLDSETEYVVQEALERLMRSRTTMVIAHRLSTILHADLIAVIDHGQIVEQGKHYELLAKNGLYARLYHLQYDNSTIQKVRKKKDSPAS